MGGTSLQIWILPRSLCFAGTAAMFTSFSSKFYLTVFRAGFCDSPSFSTFFPSANCETTSAHALGAQDKAVWRLRTPSPGPGKQETPKVSNMAGRILQAHNLFRGVRRCDCQEGEQLRPEVAASTRERWRRTGFGSLEGSSCLWDTEADWSKRDVETREAAKGETEVREALDGLPYGWEVGDENKKDPKVSGLGSYLPTLERSGMRLALTGQSTSRRTVGETCKALS